MNTHTVDQLTRLKEVSVNIGYYVVLGMALWPFIILCYELVEKYVFS